MTGNFVFLAEQFSALEKMGSLAEIYMYTDPNACIYKLGSLAETMVNYIFDMEESLTEPSGGNNTQYNKVNILLSKKFIDQSIFKIFDMIRKNRNEAVHAGHDSFDDCVLMITGAYTISVWFIRIYGDREYTPDPFVMPYDIRNRADYQTLLEENERLTASLEKALKDALHRKAHTHVHASERRQRAEKATRDIRLSEREIRYIIEEQLQKTGWEADTYNLRYSKGTRPEEGRNIAIAEWPTDLTVCKWGFVDYALFAGNKLVGVVEANADRKDIPSSIDNQCREYSMGVKEEHTGYLTGVWGEYKVPFLFATNGKAYNNEFEERTGVWFRDARSETNIPKVLQGWIDPQGLLDMLEYDIETANNELAELPYDQLRDKDGLDLRPYQIEAIEKAEGSVLEGGQTALLTMASGTGKTRTVLGMVHRFLKTGRFNRILFLVDSADTGEQTLNAFREVSIKGNMTLEQIYGAKAFGDDEPDSEAKIHVATVDSLAKRIIYNDAESMPSVTYYDLIVVDEGRSGFVPVGVMGDDGQPGLSPDDYLSNYRSVIDYFDAVKIALTSAPELRITEIFGKPVFEYSHRRAVTEGYLADHG